MIPLPALASLPTQIAGALQSKPVWPSNPTKATAGSVERKRRLAEALMQQGMDTSPIQSPWQGAARMAQALVGGMAMSKADKQDAELQAEAEKKQAMADALAQSHWDAQFGLSKNADERAQSQVDMQSAEQARQEQIKSAQKEAIAAQLSQNTTHPQGMQGPQQPMQPGQPPGPMTLPYNQQQMNDAQFKVVSQDYAGANAALNPMASSNEPFTLGEGQVRYGPNGMPLASNPKGTGQTARPATPQEKAQYGMPPTAPMYFDGEGTPKMLNDGKLVSIDMGQGEVGTIPPGYELMTDPKTGARSMHLIQGGPAWQEQQDLKAKAANTQATQAESGDIVTTDIGRALDKMAGASLPTTGLVGNITKDIPGPASHDVSKLLSTISGNVGFDRLQQMRNDSPTGGALGQINKSEMDLLQAVKGNLEQSQTTPQLEYNMKRLNNIYLDIIHGPGNGPPRYDLNKRGAVMVPNADNKIESPGDPAVGSVEGGYRFKGGDPTQEQNWGKVQ